MISVEHLDQLKRLTAHGYQVQANVVTAGP
jgi:hypothetical protein